MGGGRDVEGRAFRKSVSRFPDGDIIVGCVGVYFFFLEVSWAGFAGRVVWFSAINADGR